MKQSYVWLLALLTVLAPMTITTSAMAEDGEAHIKGNIEIGAAVMDTDDNPARVDEYVKTSDEDDNTVNPALDLGLHITDQGISVGAEVDYDGSDNYDMGLEADINRVFKIKVDTQSLQHRKDHETLDQMGATARDDTGGSQPNVTTDKIYADLIENGLTPSIGGANLTDPDTGDLAYDPAEAWAEEISNDYLVTRKVTEGEAELTLPALPNVTVHAGMRLETREGMEQAIGLSKCAGCHVTAAGKDIDERTEDFTIGATGKFGKLTVDYEYLTRDFEEQADNPSRWYVNTSPDAPPLIKDSGLLYKQGEFEYAKTPDSEKDSHMIKARYDLDSKTSFSGSYVNAEIESSKTGETGVFEIDDTLTSEYDGFNGKIATAFGPVRLSLRGATYEIDGPEYSVTFPPREDNFTVPNHTMPTEQEYISAESREVTELGIDAVYRLANMTTLRLGYEYEDIERDEAELGETETHTLKAAVKTRFSKTLSARASYQYQDIDDPFAAHNATGIAQGNPDFFDPVSGLAYLNTAQFTGDVGNNTPDDGGSWVYYWNSVYPSRAFDATNQPDTVHEVKLNSTWAPKANLASTFFLRVRQEENNDVHYEQTTYVPGVNVWYAPDSKLNLSMSYNFNNQDTENRACVGWYHG